MCCTTGDVSSSLIVRASLRTVKCIMNSIQSRVGLILVEVFAYPLYVKRLFMSLIADALDRNDLMTCSEKS